MLRIAICIMLGLVAAHFFKLHWVTGVLLGIAGAAFTGKRG